MQDTNNKIMDNKIIRKSFWPPYWHNNPPELTEDQLGFDEHNFADVGSRDTKTIFDFMLGNTGFDMSFYYAENNKFYYIEMLDKHVFCRKDNPDWDGKYDYNRVKVYEPPQDDSEIIMSFRHRQEVWDNFKIDGKDMKYIIEHSVVWFSS